MTSLSMSIYITLRMQFMNENWLPRISILTYHDFDQPLLSSRGESRVDVILLFVSILKVSIKTALFELISGFV